MKIIAFAASNSKNSINKALVTSISNKFSDSEIEVLDLNDFEMPIYSLDKQAEIGIPDQASVFYNKIKSADLLLISFAEHNGNYTVAYKNIFDWVSRINQKVFDGKAVLAFSTSPGASGAKSVLKLFVESAIYFGANIKGSLSVPNFYQNFDMQTNTINNSEINLAIDTLIATL